MFCWIAHVRRVDHYLPQIGKHEMYWANVKEYRAGEHGRKTRNKGNEVIAWAGLLGDPHLTLQESLFEDGVGGNFARRALMGIPGQFVSRRKHFHPVGGSVTAVRGNISGVYIPVIENADFSSDAHNVPTTLWSTLATRRCVDRPHASCITKLNIRSV